MLALFFAFFKMGLFTFGGGYAMIPLVTEIAVNQFGMNEAEVLNFIAISESTPGPIAINMATFVGFMQYGFWGALVATLGVVLPSFLVILLIVAVIKNLMKYNGVQAFLKGVRPVVVGLILATGVKIFLQVIFSIKTINSTFVFDYMSLIIFAIIVAVSVIYKRIKKSALSPIILIIFSALLGILLYGVF